MHSTPIFQVAKISEDIFLTACGYGNVFVLSYSKNEVIRKLSNSTEIFSKFSRIVLSPLFVNCFWTNGRDLLSTVALINYNRDEKVLEFEHLKHDDCDEFSMTLEPSAGAGPFTLDVFVKNQEEVVVTADDCGKICFYNAGNLSNYETTKLRERESLVRVVDVCNGVGLTSARLVRDKYIFCGDCVGTIYGVRIPEEFSNLGIIACDTGRSVKLSSTKSYESRDIEVIRFFPDELVVAFAFGNGSVRISRISGLNDPGEDFTTQTNRAMDPDLGERLLFMREGFKCRIKLKNTSILFSPSLMT